ncbi:hypothetical protein N7478_003497 [Penicillium angulare]|uniref:uncharacterized protein n=1 Tax=Penicillium angulare TaxID=116970 RepID=UPI00254185BC|nr:uncharacterized protein N7478_003497 [Penicillium angulare]KAJ5287811.1 hypothetical protein N7478_003497 [Penicillium angulare]
MGSTDDRVIIVGGSIAGLSLALMLEKNGIDFLVLEGYPSIAPQVGASIGVLANGLRILDQLGCCEEVVKAAEFPVETVLFRDSHGRPFWQFEDFNQQMTARHGYPAVFLDRRMLIQILYDNIRQKDKILVSERIVSVTTHPSHASVTTKEGKEYSGTFVVGGDGIHSTVRRQMWDQAQKMDPTWFDQNEAQLLPATYACIFGISQGVCGVEKGTLTSVFNEHYSYLVPSGPGDRTYWFLVKTMDKTMYGSDIPRFTKDEEEALAKEHWDDYITPTLRFSDLYKKKLSSVYTSLPEYVYKKWYFGRIMTIGDAAHKLEPITGQGGNSAIETAAALTNNIVSALKDHPSRLCQLSNDEINSIFEQTQRQREERTWNLVKASHSRQRMECMETPLLKFVAKNVIPYIPKQLLVNNWIQTYSPAVSLNMFPKPKKDHEMPYYDELLRSPSPRGLLGYMAYAIFAIMALIGYKLLFTAGKANGTWSLLGQAVLSRSIKEIDVELRQVYTGVPSIDKLLKTLVAIFMPAIMHPSNPEQPLQLLYFLSSMLPLIGIFTIEGYRRRNRWTPIASAGFWGILYQLRGIGFIAPVYFAMSLFASRRANFFVQPGRYVPAAKFILPALVIGFIVPTSLIFFPFKDPIIQQGVIAFWQPAPLLVSCLTMIFSTAETIVSSALGWNKYCPRKPNNDLPHLRMIYQVTGVVSACLHLSLIIGCLLSAELSLTRLFVPESSFAPVGTLADGVFIFFRNDFLLVTAACVLWCLLSIWDMNRSGLSEIDLRIALGALVVGDVVIGPGATAATVWLWREKMMSRE